MENEVLRSFALRARRRLVGRTPTVNAKVKVIPTTDETFKKKVETLLAQEGVVTNPAQQLMDKRAMKEMTEMEKERYLLTTLDKFNALRHELEHDNSDTRFCI